MYRTFTVGICLHLLVSSAVLSISIADQLGFLLGRAHLEHRAIAERALAPLGLRGKAFGALILLVQEGPLSQQRLGERQGIDRTTMVAVVDELEGAGYVERRRDPRDRRAYSLHATPRGRRVLKRAAEATRRAEEEFLAPLPAAERRRLKALLRTLVAQSG
jgi:DNA-binding MarR family transcriptional regulator